MQAEAGLEQDLLLLLRPWLLLPSPGQCFAGGKREDVHMCGAGTACQALAILRLPAHP